MIPNNAMREELFVLAILLLEFIPIWLSGYDELYTESFTSCSQCSSEF